MPRLSSARTNAPLTPTPTPLCVQLSYFHRLFDMEGLSRTLGSKEAAAAAAERLAPLAPVLDRAAAVAARLRDASAYKWVDLGALYGRLTAAQ